MHPAESVQPLSRKWEEERKGKRKQKRKGKKNRVQEPNHHYFLLLPFMFAFACVLCVYGTFSVPTYCPFWNVPTRPVPAPSAFIRLIYVFLRCFSYRIFFFYLSIYLCFRLMAIFGLFFTTVFFTHSFLLISFPFFPFFRPFFLLWLPFTLFSFSFSLLRCFLALRFCLCRII